MDQNSRSISDVTASTKKDSWDGEEFRLLKTPFVVDGTDGCFRYKYRPCFAVSSTTVATWV